LEVPKKFLKNPKNFLSTCQGSNSYYADKGLIAFSLPELHHTIGECKQRIVLANTYILAGVILRPALTNDDIAGNGGLTTVDLHPKALALRVAAILYTTFTFFVSHILEIENLFD
jgi:hypothetical protein